MLDENKKPWAERASEFSSALLTPQQPRPSFLQADEKRFNVYRNNVTVSLVRALELNFPGLKSLVGEDFFRAMARDFVQQFPPKSRLLFEYGSELPGFIENANSLAQYPFLADIARFEHLWLESFHEADTLPLQPATFQRDFAAAGSDLKLQPHPAARFLSSGYPIRTIAMASRSGSPVAGIDLSQPERCVMSRPHLTVSASIVSQGEFVFLKALADGQKLADAADLAILADETTSIDNAVSLILSLGAFANLQRETTC